ncbi:presenilin-associated rhomboid-like protein, mitochondrial [Clytia hemisphaerica]|uniref:rhomboid protease n=1 Tax=Clytia hemisphaerica TaxID=252671 RepID=A0A7M5UTV3_9CNID
MSIYFKCSKSLSRFTQSQTWRKVLNTTRSYHNELTTRPALLQPVLFTAGVSIGSFAGCSILQYERVKTKMGEESSISKLLRRRKEKGFEFRNQINKWWNGLHEGHKVAGVIIGMNLLVFSAWQLKGLRSFMVKWFTSTPAVKKSSPLLLSCFSHSDIWHIGANMFVLWSFAPLIQSLLGTEQFIGFYTAGGTISSLASYYFKVAVGSAVPSLGASGALLAVLAACCIERPDARLSILFLPFFTFSAQTALYSIIAIDVTGLLLRWKLFDHAGHLGGTLFGSWYVMKGHEWTWDKRGPFIRWWHELRQSMNEK